jgi:hypothetical protein
MQQLDFYQFLRNGLLTGLSVGCKESEIFKLLGHPAEIEDYGRKGKYLHYDYLRFGLTDDCLSDITYFFYNTKAHFKIQSGEEIYQINESTPLTRVLNLLNEWEVPWEIPFQESNLDYAVVKLGNGNKIYYYLYTSKLERISRNLSA